MYMCDMQKAPPDDQPRLLWQTFAIAEQHHHTGYV